jgi:CHAD domain-containing protein
VGMAATAAVAFGRDQHMLAQSGQQMTTDRTPIRRWLEIGGAAHRPPFGARRAKHRSIVAPLAATLAATAAVGLGVVLARAGSERRTERLRRRQRRLGLGPEEGVAAGLRRMAIAQADRAIEEIEGARGESSRRAVHEARKAIKRLRSIVRLLEGELGRSVCAREQASLRAAAAVLAEARDAEVMLATLELLIKRHARTLAGRRQIERLHEHLSARRDRAELLVGDPETRNAAANELRAFRSRAGAWHLTERPGIGAVEVGLKRIYRQGRRRRRRAARAKGGRMLTMHQWRKRVKDLRYAAEILERPAPPRRGSRSRRARARAEAKWLHRLATRADELGELLGEEHDLAVFGQWLRSEGKRAGVRRATKRRLEKLITARRAELRRRALRDGKRLYRRSPKEFVARVGRACERAGPKLS